MQIISKSVTSISCELSAAYIKLSAAYTYYRQIIGMHIQDNNHEIPKHCEHDTFCLQAEVSCVGIYNHFL